MNEPEPVCLRLKQKVNYSTQSGWKASWRQQKSFGGRMEEAPAEVEDNKTKKIHDGFICWQSKH